MKIKSIWPTLWVTLSFRDAKRYGWSHMAGQPAALVKVGKAYDFYSQHGVRLGRCSTPSDLLSKGGIMRRAEQEYPTRAKPRRR